MRETIGHDLRAGLVVFLVALFSGIISGVIGGVIVTAISRSRLGVSGPAAGLAVVVANAIGQLGFEAFLLVLVVAGLIQIVAGFARAGIVGHYVPSAVISGMLAGIGVILVLKQIPPALGYLASWEGETEFLQSDGHNTFSEMYYALQALSPGAALISLLSLGVLLLWQRPRLKNNQVLRSSPGPLVVVLLGVGLNEVFGAINPSWRLGASHLLNIPVAGGLAEFFGQFTLPDFSQITNPAFCTTAVTLAIIASLESLLLIGYKLANVAGLVLTDMLTGILLGLTIGIFQILMYNYRIAPYTEQLAPDRFRIRLTEHMTFLNKASLRRVLREFATHAAATSTELRVEGRLDVETGSLSSDSA